MLSPCMRNALVSVKLVSLTVALLISISVLISSAEGKIAFVSNRNGNNEIYLMNDDGSNEINISNHPASDLFPSISPDGSRLAFCSNRHGLYDLYTMNIDGTRIIQLTFGATINSYGESFHSTDWSIDGEKLIYTVRDSNIWHLYQVNTDGSNLKLISDGVHLDIHSAYYSIDGSKIYMNRNTPYNGYTSEVYVSNADGSLMKQLTSLATGSSRAGVSIWPVEVAEDSGTKIAFTRNVTHKQAQIFTMNPDGSTQTNISNNEYHEFRPSAARGINNSILFVSNRAGDSIYDIWRMNTDGSNPVQLTFEGGSAPYWVPGNIVDDSDGDGVPDDQDICANGDDNIDSDEDGVPDFCDSCPNDAENDADGDGVCGDLDTCLGGDDRINSDGDSLPDFCDICPHDIENDADSDGICELEDNCPLVANSNQLDTDEDGWGNECDNDDDNDSITDNDDNCPLIWNPDQDDFDEDGTGDFCDRDDDNDGIQDGIDQCPSTPFGEIINEHGCSIGDICPCNNEWKNHGVYVKCVAQSSEAFVSEGLITEAQKDAIVSNAAESDCGHKK